MAAIPKDPVMLMSFFNSLTRDKCDYIVSIPMRGRVNSLNASNAAAVLLFEALRRRLGH